MKKLVVLAALAALFALAVAAPAQARDITPQSGCAPAGCWPTYSFGDRDTDVITVQYLLRSRGFANFQPNNGFFGPLTQQAVRNFQRSEGLRVTGQVGPATWRALIVPLRFRANNDAVRGLQVQLRDQYGYDVPVTGFFGRITRAAVRDFQARHGLVVTGGVNLATWRTIISAR